MSSPVRTAIELYVENRRNFSKAITMAGGCAEIILDSDEWFEVLHTLAANNISVDAIYRGATEEKK